MSACCVSQVGDREWWCATHRCNAQLCGGTLASLDPGLRVGAWAVGLICAAAFLSFAIQGVMAVTA